MLLALAVLCAHGAYADDFEDGVEAYWSGDYATALAKHRPLAQSGNTRSQYRLGVMYAHGQGVRRDDQEALRWYRLAAEQGEAWAQFSLGTMYAQGWGVPRDYKAAMRWYRLSAEQGDARAQYQLGAMYARGEGARRDYKEARRWYLLAAEQDFADAQESLAVMYVTGEGVRQDANEAQHWYRLAGMPQGMHALGYRIPEDPFEAIRLIRLSLERDDQNARYNKQGDLHNKPRGNLQDYKEAMRWYRLAAEQGDALAQITLGMMYYKGQGTPKDYVHAYLWETLAAAQWNERAVDNRAIVASKMMPSQLEQAKTLARECVARNFKSCD